MSTLDRAIQIAVKAHAGQTRKDGTPYILHPIRVMMRQSGLTAMIVAVLHDVVEESDITLDDLKREGFSRDIITALRLLTRRKGVSYRDYISAIATNPLARAVKLADLEDNMNLDELARVTKRDIARTAKYRRA